MPSMKRITREDILHQAFELLREKGIDGVNARSIARALSCSVQPIFYQFDNMEELKKELLNVALDYYRSFLLHLKGIAPEYKEVGINYIRFAKEEANLFRFIFMTDYHIKIEEFAFFDKSYHQVEAILSSKKQISEDCVKQFHLRMWIFTHGIACLIATGTCEFTEEEISSLLTDEFQVLLKSID